MNKYKTVYNFNVLEELKKGEEVYIIDKSKRYSTESITKASEMKAKFLIDIIESENKDERYEFYKVVETDE